MNNKGIVPLDILFTGGVGSAAGSGFLLVAILAMLVAFNPSSTTPFRENKAIEICEFNGGTDCKQIVDLMTKDEIFDYIQDSPNNPVAAAFYAPKQIVKSGGDLRARILAAQK